MSDLMRFTDKTDGDVPPSARPVLIFGAPDSAGRMEVGCWGDGSASARGCALGIDMSQINFLHEQLGRVLLESGVTQRSPMGVESEARKELHRARTAMKTAWKALVAGEGSQAENVLARYLLGGGV